MTTSGGKRREGVLLGLFPPCFPHVALHAKGKKTDGQAEESEAQIGNCSLEGTLVAAESKEWQLPAVEGDAGRTKGGDNSTWSSDRNCACLPSSCLFALSGECACMDGREDLLTLPARNCHALLFSAGHSLT